MSKLKPRIPLKSRTLAGMVEELRARSPRSRSKVKMLDGVPHRVRRGVLVEIPTGRPRTRDEPADLHL
jgi:hypothetical protein